MLSIVVRHNRYQDSVVLMQASRTLTQLDGVVQASVMMGTPANKEILVNTGFGDPRQDEAGPGDLVIAVDAETQEAADRAVDAVEDVLSGQSAASHGSHLPRVRTLRRALEKQPGANLALVSIPGEYVGPVVTDLLERGLHTMIFSDNVSVEDEVRLKAMAEERGLLVMGPDCGTSVLRGVPLAFANVCRPGGIGIVGASGTGTQEVMSQVDRLGGGCSNAIGLGGRDLNEQVGGVSCLAALRALDADPATSVIVLVTKPPAPAVRDRVEKVAESLATPVVALYLGEHPSSDADRNGVRHAHTCADAAEIAVELEGAALDALPAGQRGIRGLYTGGTLASEAAMLISEAFGVPLPADHARGLMLDGAGHRIVDLGDDAYTRGRPHPMIDPASRAEILPSAYEDAGVGVVLLDLVLGYGSGDDPATPVADAVREGTRAARAAGRIVRTVASICGTAADPQGFDRERQILQDAGVEVLPSNAAAVRHAIALVTGAGSGTVAPIPEPTAALLAGRPSVVNIGLQSFAQPIAQAGSDVVQFDWSPTAGGDPHLAALVRALERV